MPATILFPYAIGTQFKCRGYSIRNDFRGLAYTVTFHHRLRQSQDISLTLSLRHDLLFTASFLSSTRAERSAVVPGTKLHAVTRIDAREGQVRPKLSGTREGIDDMEGQSHCLRNCLSCTPTLPVVEPVPNKDTLNYACMDRECPCVMHTMSQESDAYCLPCDTSSDMATPDPPPSYSISHLTRDQLRILWHQRLGHLHNRGTKLLSKTAIGVPDLATDDDLHKCPVCMAAKLRKANKGTKDSRRATMCNQGISIDAGFIVQSSKDSKRMQRYTGLNGETCYFTIVDHKSGTIYGETCASKAPPIEFVNRCK
jgi:GAG-pre-integrase domain